MRENYEDLILEADKQKLIVKEKPLTAHDGRIKGKKIAIRRDIKTSAHKACVLAEELGHYYTSTGNILNLDQVQSRKQELIARGWAYDKLVGLSGIVSAYEKGCRNKFEIAEYLTITEEFLEEALKRYREKYGLFKYIDNYVIYFEPNLQVLKII